MPVKIVLPGAKPESIYSQRVHVFDSNGTELKGT